LWDAVSIIVGIIIGAGIFKAPAEVFHNVSAPWQALAVWALGGVLSLLGALCYAELASAYPRSGGEYVYLTRAYGSGAGFLFAWAQLAIIRPGGGIAMLAFLFAGEAAQLWGLDPWTAIGLAVLTIAALTLVNVLGASPGKQTQNLLTVVKVLSLGGIVVAGFCFAVPPETSARKLPVGAPSFVVMMMFVLYAYDGWNEAAYVSREVRDPRRNLPRALILGTAAVTVIYLLVNAAYLVGLGFSTVQATQAGAASILTQALGPVGGQVMSVLVMVTVLGALNGTIFTGARIFSEMGADHRLFAPLGWWSQRWQTPAWSLAVQALISIGMLVGVSLWWQNRDGFETVLKGTAPVFWLFLLLTGMSLFVLRWKDRTVERPFRVPLYPLTPLLFCAWSSFMLFGSLFDGRQEALIGLAVLLAGVPLYLLSRWLARPAHRDDARPPWPLAA
jgi:amino acid transporter